MAEWLVRTEMLIGKENIQKLKNARVAVFGVGGVGGFATEALARCGIGHIELIDHDTVSESNLNRQIVATHPVPEQINGYEYEVLSCIKAIQEGKIECEEMPHEETLWVMRLMDRIRNDWGMIYPFEK